MALFEIEKFMKQYAIEEQFGKDYETEIEDRFVNPDPDESTEYGEIEPEQNRRKHGQSDLPLLHICRLRLHVLEWEICPQ